MKKLLLTGLLVLGSVSSYARTCTILLDSSIPTTGFYADTLFRSLKNAKLTRDVNVKTELGLKIVTLMTDRDTGEKNAFGDPIVFKKSEYNVQLFKDGSLVTETGYDSYPQTNVIEMLIERLPYGCK